MHLGTISRIEKYFYFGIWIVAVLYSIYCFATGSYLYFQFYKDKYDDFTDGFYYLSNRRDKSDFEWESLYYLILTFFPWLLVYIIVSEVIRYLALSCQVSQIWQICFSILYISTCGGYIMVFLILLQPGIFYLICNSYRKTIFTWLSTGITLLFIMYYKQIISNEEFVKNLNLNDEVLYFSVSGLFWMNLKCTGYFLEKQSSKELLNFLSYCFHPPTIFTGPFILYKDYLTIYKPSTLTFGKRVRRFVLNLSRCLFWFVFANFCLHFVYVNATSYQPKLVKKFDNWSLYGYGYAMGQFFHIKYLVMYGLSTSVASFENVTVPRLPRCIGRIHLYSDMWKYFDPGLYKFLLRYIYVPLREICSLKLIASFMCFLFVYLWHGVENYILVWTILNYIGITLEYLTSLIYKNYFEKYYGETVDADWLRRAKCLLAAPLLALSAISNFYFFAGSEIGNIFAGRIIQGTFHFD